MAAFEISLVLPPKTDLDVLITNKARVSAAFDIILIDNNN